MEDAMEAISDDEIDKAQLAEIKKEDKKPKEDKKEKSAKKE